MIKLKIQDQNIPISCSKVICIFPAESEIVVTPAYRYFFKPPSSLTIAAAEFHEGLGELEGTISLVTVIGKMGKGIEGEEISSHILGYTFGVGLCVKTMKEEAMELGLPWSRSEGLDNFALVAPVLIPEHNMDISKINLEMFIKGEKKKDLLLSFEQN
ncbi:fumarylacetoacetate hydrolase family protein [Candidatus Riflebacteria bacterium]